MGKVWKQTPRGGWARVEDAPAPTPLDEPDTEGGPPVGVPVLQPFVDACLTALPRSLPAMGAREKLGLCLFLLGAADHLWSRQGLDDRRYPAAAETILRGLGIEPEKAATIVAALPQVAQEPIGRQALLQGAQTFERWYEGGDVNAVLVVPELVSEWRTEPAPGGAP
ncbi:MAG: hypothetical protein PVF91_11975 [Chromatiales bacterium]|jgi:hypothetical protein